MDWKTPAHQERELVGREMHIIQETELWTEFNSVFWILENFKHKFMGGNQIGMIKVRVEKESKRFNQGGGGGDLGTDTMIQQRHITRDGPKINRDSDSAAAD